MKKYLTIFSILSVAMYAEAQKTIDYDKMPKACENYIQDFYQSPKSIQTTQLDRFEEIFSIYVGRVDISDLTWDLAQDMSTLQNRYQVLKDREIQDGGLEKKIRVYYHAEESCFDLHSALAYEQAKQAELFVK